jgi:hypothetical protein
MSHFSLTHYTGRRPPVLRSVGSLSPVTVLEPDDVIEMIGGNLEQPAISESGHPVESSRGDMENGLRPEVM